MKINKGQSLKKYCRQSYGSCTLHFSSMRSICVWSFKSVPQRLLELCSGQELSMKLTKGNNSNNTADRVIILAHCMSPQWDLSVYEVWIYFFIDFWRYAPDKNYVWKSTKGNNSKHTAGRVMVLAHCTSPQWDLSVYEVNTSKTFWVMLRTRMK